MDQNLLKETKDTLVYRCPYCGTGEITIRKQSKHQYGYCDTCEAAYIHYIPLPHQMDIHRSKASLKLVMGGMGSAKSRAGVMEIIDHALNVPNGRTLIMAQTLKQLSKAIMPIFDTYLPRRFVTKWTDTKADIEIDLMNGHEIIGVASDDEEKLRSMDITAFLIEEASGVKPEIFQECIRRSRNVAGVIDDVSHYLGIIISNPAQGFIRELLFSASKIHGSKSIEKTVETYKNRIKNPNPDLEAFLSSSRDNTYLPKGFIDKVINSLTPQQVRLYVDCIIEYAEGAVYPDFLQHLCDRFEIPKDWHYYLAHDPGIADPAAVLLMAQDPETGELYACDEFYKTDQVISQVGDAIEKMIKDIPPGMLHTPLIDPSANKRNKINRKTYKQQMQLEHNIIFKDANNRIEDGIAKVRDMFYHKKIWIFRDLVNTIYEGCEYRYPTLEERNDKKNIGDLPIDKNNHLMDCLRYICQEVPYDYLDKSRLAINSIRNFFGNMGYRVLESNKRAAAHKTFNQIAQDIVNMDQYERQLVKNNRCSGGYKI